MSKKNQNTANENVNEVTNDEAQNVETPVTNDEAQNAPVVELSEEVKKAKRIISATLPKLREHNLSFEPRTNNFFNKMEVTKTDEKTGEIIKDEKTGEPEKVVRRLVVSLVEYKEDENGKRIAVTDENGEPVLTETAQYCLDEINAKRSANLVANEEKKRTALTDEIAELEKTLQTKRDELANFDASVEEAKALVMSFELPESSVTARVKVSEVKEKLSAAERQLEAEKAEKAKLRAMLLATGMYTEEQLDNM